MKIRREIRTLGPAALQAFRDAWRKMETTSAFQELAGLHGLPNDPSTPTCPHYTYEFLPWHRFYMASLEELLEANGFNEGLPYWRWTHKTDTVNGIPAAFSEPTYRSADGNQYPNPLLQGRINFESSVSIRNGSLIEEDNLDLQESENEAYDAENFWSAWWGAPVGFSNLIEQPHDDLHVYVGGPGGAMSSTARASYDPIFWAHHSYVDQQWATWQSLPNTAPLPASIANSMVRHYDKPISSTLDYQALGYEYDELGAAVSPAPAVAFTAAVPLADLPSRRHTPIKVPVVFGGLRMIDQSLKLHVFADTEEGSSHDPRHSNPHFVRTIHIFGMGGAKGPGMFMGEYTRRADIGPAIARLGVAPGDVRISVEVEDEYGNEVDLKTLGITLQVSGL